MNTMDTLKISRTTSSKLEHPRIFPEYNYDDDQNLLTLSFTDSDLDKILNELGWRPTTNFSDGLRETVIWYLNNQDWLFDPDKISYNGDRLGHLTE